MPKNGKQDVKQKVLLVEDRDGKFRITIPDDWKVTFGRSFQRDPKARFDEPAPMCLRIYEKESQQRAVFMMGMGRVFLRS